MLAKAAMRSRTPIVVFFLSMKMKSSAAEDQVARQLFDAGAGEKKRRQFGLGRSGTGSKPPGCNGVHLTKRRTARNAPKIAPWARTASTAYCEQVGAKRQPQVGPSTTGRTGEIIR